MKIIILSFSITSLHAQTRSTKQTINILTWWGYLDSQQIIQGIENKCNVKISIDQYYTNAEFLRRYRENLHLYDVVIFSNAIFEGIRNDLPNIKNSSLWMQSSKYNESIKKHYIEGKYPKNVVYFGHTVAGILYNPDYITLSDSDFLQDIIKKSENKIIILMDDAVELDKLLSLDAKMHKVKHLDINNTDSQDKLFNLNHNSKLYFGNSFKNIYKDTNFGLAFIWSGEAIERIKSTNSKLKFYIHPEISYLSSDLIAENNESNNTHCVAEYLSSEDTLGIIQNNSYYFSPYTNLKYVTDATLKEAYDRFLTLLPQLTWVESIGWQDFYRINKSWDMVKLKKISIND